MTETPDNPKPEEEPSPQNSEEAKEDMVRLLETRALQLQNHIQEFSGDLKVLSESLEARKRETTVLKIMLYTGLIVLMLAFFYSSNALHRAQLESFEHNLEHLQTLTETNIATLQSGVMRDLQGMQKRLMALEATHANAYDKERRLNEVLMSMNSAVTPLATRSPEMSERVGDLHRQSEELFSEFQRYAADSTLPQPSFTD